MAYVTVERVRLQSQLEALTTDQTSLVTQNIPIAERLIDKWTGTWWELRTAVTVKTEAADALQRSLFMPAQIKTITSITEDGIALAAADFVVYDSWIEKLGTPAFNEPAGAFSYWTLNQQGIVVVGDFGFASADIPPDIVGAATEVAAIISGLKRRSFTAGEGIEQTVLVNQMPEWVQDVVFSNKFEHTPNRLVISPLVT